MGSPHYRRAGSRGRTAVVRMRRTALPTLPAPPFPRGADRRAGYAFTSCAASRHDWNSSAARDGRGERRSRLTNRHR